MAPTQPALKAQAQAVQTKDDSSPNGVDSVFKTSLLAGAATGTHTTQSGISNHTWYQWLTWTHCNRFAWIVLGEDIWHCQLSTIPIGPDSFQWSGVLRSGRCVLRYMCFLKSRVTHHGVPSSLFVPSPVWSSHNPSTSGHDRFQHSSLNSMQARDICYCKGMAPLRTQHLNSNSEPVP